MLSERPQRPHDRCIPAVLLGSPAPIANASARFLANGWPRATLLGERRSGQDVRDAKRPSLGDDHGMMNSKFRARNANGR